MNANFLPLALGKIDELGRDRETRRLLQERADLASERTAGNVGQPEGVFDYRIIGAADFRAIPSPPRCAARCGRRCRLPESIFQSALIPFARCANSCRRVPGFSLVIRYKRRWLRKD